MGDELGGKEAFLIWCTCDRILGQKAGMQIRKEQDQTYLFPSSLLVHWSTGLLHLAQLGFDAPQLLSLSMANLTIFCTVSSVSQGISSGCPTGSHPEVPQKADGLEVSIGDRPWGNARTLNSGQKAIAGKKTHKRQAEEARANRKRGAEVGPLHPMYLKGGQGKFLQRVSGAESLYNRTPGSFSTEFLIPTASSFAVKNCQKYAKNQAGWSAAL